MLSNLMKNGKTTCLNTLYIVADVSIEVVVAAVPSEVDVANVSSEVAVPFDMSPSTSELRLGL